MAPTTSAFADNRSGGQTRTTSSAEMPHCLPGSLLSFNERGVRFFRELRELLVDLAVLIRHGDDDS
jgi:hypothetical protein